VQLDYYFIIITRPAHMSLYVSQHPYPHTFTYE